MTYLFFDSLISIIRIYLLSVVLISLISDLLLPRSFLISLCTVTILFITYRHNKIRLHKTFFLKPRWTYSYADFFPIHILFIPFTLLQKINSIVYSIYYEHQFIFWILFISFTLPCSYLDLSWLLFFTLIYRSLISITIIHCPTSTMD